MIEYFSFRKYPKGYFVQNLQMDFFNYAGIHHPVKLYVTPTCYLLDILLVTNFTDSIGTLKFKSSISELEEDDDHDHDDVVMTYEVIDADGNKQGGQCVNEQ